MKTIIVPVDFSDTSLNAARYAAQMFSGFDHIRIVLYHMFNNRDEEEVSGNYLESLRRELADKGDKEIEYLKDFGDDLAENISRLAQQKAASLVVMGITGRNNTLAQAMMGSNTLRMVDKNVCPVLIIPPNAGFRKIQNVAFTSDFKNIDETTPVLFIKSILNLFNPDLHIVNVDSSHYVSITDEYQEGRSKMAELFNEYNPQFYFIGS